VHAYGHLRICESVEEKLAALKRLIRETDGDYLQQFDALPPEFVAAKLKGIVAFEIIVNELQGRFKLSQDRTPSERQTIIAALRAEEDSTRATIGALMASRLT
ncbi:MAG: FMN-binding negative transcriptional regulator, partial [Chloroflexi bacterium]|nr:FMN-binding negative transcriptional regulator [Chloroflexota bacterium]